VRVGQCDLVVGTKRRRDRKSRDVKESMSQERKGWSKSMFRNTRHHKIFEFLISYEPEVLPQILI
jgi:hypothetical protein